MTPRCSALVVLSPTSHPPNLVWCLLPSWMAAKTTALGSDTRRSAATPVPRSPREQLLGFYTTVVLWGRFSSTRFRWSLPAVPAGWNSCAADIQTPSSSRKVAASAMPVLPHEGHDAGRGPGQFEEGVSQQFLGCGSLRGLPHQHRVQEAPEDRGDLVHVLHPRR